MVIWWYYGNKLTSIEILLLKLMLSDDQLMSLRYMYNFLLENYMVRFNCYTNYVQCAICIITTILITVLCVKTVKMFKLFYVLN